ncbi:MAG: molybdopterin dehydrogenase FAD-binding protein [Spirochaetes bacterium]|nr:MAG: molybdopterin dehydrogenase FAD-binding protein [Spirochaetota bacterium]
MHIGRYEFPQSLDEAAASIFNEGAVPLGGGAWTNAVSRPIHYALDLSDLGLRYIEDRGREVAIGAMATLRDIEISLTLDSAFCGIFSKALGHVVGVQLRNLVTAGGSVAGRYGFSDLNTVFLALGATVVFHDGATSSCAEFLEAPRNAPFLIKEIRVPKGSAASYQSLRVAANDFPILNVCVATAATEWRVSVGARPQAARLSLRAAEFLGLSDKPEDRAIQAGLLAAAELKFGDDTRGSAEYRRELCSVLVKRAVVEAGQRI